MAFVRKFLASKSGSVNFLTNFCLLSFCSCFFLFLQNLIFGTQCFLTYMCYSKIFLFSSFSQIIKRKLKSVIAWQKVKIRARRRPFFVLISWCENPPSGERVEELRNGYWRPRQFHLSPAIFPFLSPPSLPFSLPRYFLPALVFNFFSSSLTRYIPTPFISLVTLLVHLSVIAILQLVLTKPK